MTLYHIQTAKDISAKHIRTILKYWDITEWIGLTPGEFRKKFIRSEFHILTTENSELLAVARINSDFSIRANGYVYEFSEFTGFVSAVKGKGYGTMLLKNVIKNLQDRKIETIGFCEENIRPFYLKAQIEIMHDFTGHLREKVENEWIVPDVEDMVCICLSSDRKRFLRSLSSENLGYLLFES